GGTNGAETIPTSSHLREALSGAIPLARHAPVVGSDHAILTAASKARIATNHDAIAVDMESHAAGRAARDLGIPFAVLRAIADPADRAVPPLALDALHADGTTSAWPVIKGLFRRPWLLPAMLRLGGDSKRAHAALARAVAGGAIETALSAIAGEEMSGRTEATHPSTSSG
ncbi:MAG: hypothetical protein AAF942_13935, partial [Pseudomonadota bacterium]